MAADIIHPGHINIIKEGKKLGSVIIGLLTDEAIISYKRIPVMNYEHRLEVVKNIKGVDKVMAQKSLDYCENLKVLRPDYLLHGDDWKTGVMSKPRKEAIKVISQWGGQVVEPKYTRGISSSALIEKLKSID